MIFRNSMQPKNCKLSRNYITYKPYHKPHDETIYIHAQSNHTANILKQLLILIETRLTNLSSNPEIFHAASKHYQNILNQSGYDYKFQYKPPNIANQNKNRLKITKETSSDSTHLFQSKPATTFVNISFF